MTAKEHNKLVGIFLMAHGGMQAMVVLILAIVYGALGVGLSAMARKTEEQFVGLIFIIVAVAIVVFSLFFILAQILGGYKLLKETPGARNWGIVGSIVALLSFPLGTAAGVYGLWFLFGEQGKGFYLGGSMQPAQFSPPPPQDWR
jgi:uncharacterized BrkB/YihY/UPF0761 family membrane protein